MNVVSEEGVRNFPLLEPVLAPLPRASCQSIKPIESSLKTKTKVASQNLSGTALSLNDHEITVAAAKVPDPTTEKIFKNYAQSLADIEQKRLSTIEQVERATKNREALEMVRGIRSTTTSDLEEKKNKKLLKIEQQAMRDRMLLFIQTRSNLLAYQQSLFENIFKNYSLRLGAFQKFPEKLAKSQIEVDQILQEESRTLEVKNLEKASDQELEAIFKKLMEYDEARFIALKPLMRLSINCELNKIEATLSTIEQIISASKQNSFIHEPTFVLLREQFLNAKESFFIAEAIDPNEAKALALHNATALEIPLQELQREIERSSKTAELARLDDRLKLNEKIKLLDTLLSDLRSSQQAWKQIAADSKYKIKTTNLEPHFFDLNIFSTLNTISSDEDQYWLLGRRGEIEVMLPKNLNENRKLYREGNDLLRLAVLRDFGSNGLQRFDHEFRNDLVAENPLTVAQLKQFSAQEHQKNSSSFYLSSVHSLQELIFSQPRSDDAERLMKADQAVFKTFTSSLLSQNIFSEEQMQEEALHVIKESFKEIFDYLSEEKKFFILKRFEEQFENKDTLTVARVREFFYEEIKRQQSYLLGQDMIKPLLYSLASNIKTLLLENITSLPCIASLGALPLLAVGIVMGVGNDLKGLFEQLSKGRSRRH